jgi:hypothetical protein
MFSGRIARCQGASRVAKTPRGVGPPARQHHRNDGLDFRLIACQQQFSCSTEMTDNWKSHQLDSRWPFSPVHCACSFCVTEKKPATGMTLEGARGLRSVTKIGQNYFVARFRPVRIKITKKEDDQPMRKGMQTAILLLLVGACLQTGKAQSCTAGNLEFSEQHCWCGGGWRTVLYCQAQGGSW